MRTSDSGGQAEFIWAVERAESRALPLPPSGTVFCPVSPGINLEIFQILRWSSSLFPWKIRVWIAGSGYVSDPSFEGINFPLL